MTRVPMKSLFSKTFIRRFGYLLNLVKELNHSLTQIPLETILVNYKDYIESRCHHLGMKQACSLLKEIHLIAVKIAMNRPFIPIPFLKSDKEGVPRCIKTLLPLLKGEVEWKRIALSITKLYLRLILPPSTDFSSITDPGTGYNLGIRWTKFLTSWVKKFRTPNLAWNGYWHSSTKKGPNGPALVTCHEDMTSLSNNSEVLDNLRAWNTLTGNSSLSKIIENLRIKWSTIVKGDFNHSKLGLIPEGGGKTRQIAIGDYFTQESMQALFRASMKALRQLETDGTYDQERVVWKTRQAIQDGKPIHCLDLSTATDRFPVTLQEDLLGCWIGKDRAKAWRALLTNRGFSYGTEEIVYSIGQPMGILSSWSVFALTHHAIIEYCGYLEGYQAFREYVVLGDDVAIFCSRVSKRYKIIMTQIGVPISEVKSFNWVPGDDFPPSAEIAKRLLYMDKEITPIPFDLVNTWSRAPDKEALTLVLGLRRIGIELPITSWETLSKCVDFRQRRRLVVTATCPTDLIGRKHGLCSPLKGVTQGPWSCIDLTQYPRIMSEILIKDLERKQQKIMDLHAKLFDESFWCKFTSSGEPISLSVLGIGSLDLNQLHPLSVVINNRLEGLWKVDELITKLRNNPEESGVGWEDVFKCDFDLTETYISEKRKRARIQTSILFKVYCLLSQETRSTDEVERRTDL